MAAVQLVLLKSIVIHAWQSFFPRDPLIKTLAASPGGRNPTMKKQILSLVALSLVVATIAGCQELNGQQHEEHVEAHHPHHRLVVTTPIQKNVTTTQQYVCQIHSCRHIDVKALETGYLEKIPVREGQDVKEGELMFTVIPTLYKARLDTDVAEYQQVSIEARNTQTLYEKRVVSQQEVALAQAKVAKAQAKVELAKAELNFASVRAPFNGIIDRLQEQQGSLVEEGAILTTLSDNSLMWVYFNVPEAQYLEYMATMKENKDIKIELKLANGSVFDQPGKIGAIEADFNSTTGNIAFRADFANPDRLLRHGQTGTILLSSVNPGAVVIPQRAVFEILAKRYVFIVDEENKVRQREVVIEKELDDIYTIKEGLNVNDKIILEGIRQVKDGDEVEYDLANPEEVLSHLKYRAE